MNSRPTKQTPDHEDEFQHGDLEDSRSDELDDPSELDEIDLDDERWEAFLADEDELDPQPDHGDFWRDGGP